MQRQLEAASATTSAPASQLAIMKKAEAMKSSKEKAQPDQAPRNFPVPLTEAQIDEVASRAREKLPEAFALRFGTALPPALRSHPDPWIEDAKARKTAKGQRKPSDQVETEEPE